MTALLLIDIQLGLDQLDYYGGERNNPGAETNAGLLLQFCREKKIPVFHVQHSSKNPDSPLHPSKPGFALKPVVHPLTGEPHYIKHENSAFVGTSLEKDLKESGVTQLIICGLTTEHCVSTSTRMAANLGFGVTLIEDGTAAFAKQDGEITFPAQLVHEVELACLRDEFATIMTTQQWLSSQDY